MEAQDALIILRQTPGKAGESATIEDARAFLAICADRGLSPFVEASPILTDYERSNDHTHVHSLAIKEHYTVQERWAQQCGGYTVSKTEVTPHEGGLLAKVWILSNRDYADVGRMAAQIPSLNFREELKRFEVMGEALVSSREFQRKAPATKTWEWIAQKRAREGALRQKFGKEPSQSRQMYANALTQSVRNDAIAELYPVKPAYALPVSQEPEPEVEAVEGVVVEEAVPGAITIDEAAEFTTPQGTRYGELTLDQLVLVVEAYSKEKATKGLNDDRERSLKAAQIMRDHLRDGDIPF